MTTRKGGALAKTPLSLFLSFLLLLKFSPVMSRNYRYTPGDATTKSDFQTYIVQVQKPETSVVSTSEDRESWYRSFLPVTIQSSGEPRMVYSYNNVISGFAARLSKEEVKAMESKEGFVSARPDRLVPLFTTRTPNFLRLNPAEGVWKESNFGRGVIVGVLDGGILPSHPSFDDYGIPPPPAKWKGECEFNASDCNNKLIGARSFNSGVQAMKGLRDAPVAPYDDDGHGTHTASTATGRFVAGVDILGNANGTAVGMAPHAHLAVYKVCFGPDCADSDILAGMDKAVEDGVDILSLSLGNPAAPFYQDSIAIGAFGAMEKGVFVSCAAGNFGPFNTTLSNEAPWILTVGASNIDRSIRTSVKLANGELIEGESVFQPKDFKPDLLKLVYPGAGGNESAAACEDGSLDGYDVKGKVVICDRGGLNGRVDKGSVVRAAGGAAMVLANRQQEGFSTIADVHVLPASHISFEGAQKIKAYLNTTSNPTAAMLFEGTLLGVKPSPIMASFSSRGPCLACPGILKPDIIGPGVSILAAWPFAVGPTTSSATFNVESGTSMSCPHLSGIAALLKSSHPDWSPAAIKSAMMTTAGSIYPGGQPILDEQLQPASFFAIGSGHVNPVAANNPGLVYDILPEDYIPYLCGLSYTDSQVSAITRRPVACARYGSIPEGELNYPSFSVTLGPSQTFHRTVTNVGVENSTYRVKILMPEGVRVCVEPETLRFSELNERKTYSVTFSRVGSGGSGGSGNGFGQLKWVSSENLVRSPISVTFM